MASIPCSFDFTFTSTSNASSSSSLLKFGSQFLGIGKRLGWFRSSKIESRIKPNTTDSRPKILFGFRKNNLDSKLGDKQESKTFNPEDLGQVIPSFFLMFCFWNLGYW